MKPVDKMADNKKTKGNAHDSIGAATVMQWASSQTQEYSQLKKGLDSQITTCQISKLESIGFDWTVSKKMKSFPRQKRQQEYSWEFLFEQYKKYSSSLTLEKQSKTLKGACKTLSPEAKAEQNKARREARMSLSPEVKLEKK